MPPTNSFSRTRSCWLSIAILGLVPIASPALASPPHPLSAPIGTILEVKGAQTGQALTTAGATIYDGDHLQTEASSTLRVLLGESQMVLRPGTLTEVRGISNGFSAALTHGSVIVSSREARTFQVLADGAVIRPAGTEATVAQVTWVSPTELLLSSSRGTIEVSYESETKTIEAGSTYRMLIEPDDPGPQGSGGSGGPPTATGHHSNKVIYIVAGSVAAVVGVVVWRALVSPAAP